MTAQELAQRLYDSLSPHMLAHEAQAHMIDQAIDLNARGVDRTVIRLASEIALACWTRDVSGSSELLDAVDALTDAALPRETASEHYAFPVHTVARLMRACAAERETERAA